MAVPNPAFAKFLSCLGEELLLAQVLIRRTGPGFELRHVVDRDAVEAALRPMKIEELRALAQNDVAGGFRPLKSAPTLVSGWRAAVTDESQLEAALAQLYPGAVADWFAAQSGPPPVTHYREFVARQSGMYRITTMLGDVQVAAVIHATCDAGNCLKRRHWTVTGTPPDDATAKSIIPCLEPCALLLEAARKAVRIEQAGQND